MARKSKPAASRLLGRKKLTGLFLALVGLALAVFCGVAQQSSQLTPVLAKYPFLMACVASGGLLLLLFAAIVSLFATAKSRRRELYPLAALYLLLIVFVEGNQYGTAFQLSLAGLTVGGSLLVLGGSQVVSANSHSS